MRLYVKMKIEANDKKPLSNFVVVDEVVMRHIEKGYLVRIQTSEIQVTYSNVLDKERQLTCKNVDFEFEDVPSGLKPTGVTVMRELQKFEVQSVAIDTGSTESNVYSDDVSILISAASLVRAEQNWKQRDFSVQQILDMNNNIETWG